MKPPQAETPWIPGPPAFGELLGGRVAGADGRAGVRGELLTAFANAVSLSRLVLSIALIPVYELAGSGANVAVFWMVCLIWASDIADGRIARAGYRRGAHLRRDGQALDPLVDDFAYAAGFLVLLSADMVPLWFVALVMASRCLFGIVRMVGLSHGKPFARPKRVTKIKGVAFGVGQIALFGALAYPQSPFGAEIVGNLLIGAMTAVCLVAIAEFVVRANWQVLRDLLKPA